MLCVALLLVNAPRPASSASEYQLKAAFLFNFGKFVEWPEHAFESPESALRICVLGEAPFGQELDATVAGRTVGARPIEVRRMGAGAGTSACHMLFLSGAERKHLGALASTLSGAPVLLVGESDDFAREGGMINFIKVDNKIRFEINDAEARQAGLKISSKLLKLATIVESGG